jgi:zinc transporter ZupT
LHSVFDGVAMGSSFLVPALVQPVFFAIIVHKMPSAFALTSLLKTAKWSRGHIFALLTAFSLIIPVSSMLTAALFLHMPISVGSHAMNFALGSFLYIATSDFLPEIHRRGDQKTKNFIAFLIGVVVMGALALRHQH